MPKPDFRRPRARIHLTDLGPLARPCFLVGATMDGGSRCPGPDAEFDDPAAALWAARTARLTSGHPYPLIFVAGGRDDRD
jgi:hypothetical protein